MSKRVLVCGSGGLIGGHLATDLVALGHQVTGVDIKALDEWGQVAEGLTVLPNVDLSHPEWCEKVFKAGWDEVYMFAADMGGIFHIETHRVDCMLSSLISGNTIKYAIKHDVGKFLFSSSACAYSAEKQKDPNVTALKESDVFPISPELGYGTEKWFTEEMCRVAHEDWGMDVRVPRFHNVYGKFACYDGGREKAPAAICRKVAEAVISGRHEIDIWGDGTATRSFMDVADCVDGCQRLMASDFYDPINLGSSELVTINELVSIVERIAGVELERHYDLSAPQGVRGRNSDNTLIKSVLGWEPSVRLEDGLAKLYEWVFTQVETNWSGNV